MVRHVVASSRNAAVPAAAHVVEKPGFHSANGGTVYPVRLVKPVTQYSNVDGGRIDDGRYTNFRADVTKLVPSERVYTDPVKTFAYGTDASFYRLLPQVVVKVHNENEVTQILPMARTHATPVTFRAAGTSLSGQAVTDSILLKLSHTGKNFRNYEIRVRNYWILFLIDFLARHPYATGATSFAVFEIFSSADIGSKPYSLNPNPALFPPPSKHTERRQRDHG